VEVKKGFDEFQRRMGSREGWVRGGSKERVWRRRAAWWWRRPTTQRRRRDSMEEKRFSVFDGEVLHVRLPFCEVFFFLIYFDGLFFNIF
jgi:hypothetical protein